MVGDDPGSDHQEEGKKLESDTGPPQLQDSVIAPCMKRHGLRRRQPSPCLQRLEKRQQNCRVPESTQNLDAYSTLLWRRITKLEHLLIPSSGGKLEALLESDPRRKPRFAALVCHPHPLYGGTMHNKVVFRVAKAACQAGLPALRFNFRGVGKSTGAYNHGIGESEDVRAALDFLATRFPAVPVCLMGFSFGASVGLRVGATDRRVGALVGLGVPVASTNLDFLRGVLKPKLIVQGTRDQYGPRAAVKSFYASLDEPKQIYWVQNADHFFTGKLEEVQQVIRDFLKSALNLPRAE